MGEIPSNHVPFCSSRFVNSSLHQVDGGTNGILSVSTTYWLFRKKVTGAQKLKINLKKLIVSTKMFFEQKFVNEGASRNVKRPEYEAAGRNNGDNLVRITLSLAFHS